MLTARDFLHTQFKRVWRGYQPAQVDAFLRRVLTEYSALVEENARLKHRCNIAEPETKPELANELAEAQQALRTLREEEAALLARVEQFLQAYNGLISQGQQETAQMKAVLQSWKEAAASSYDQTS